MIVPLVALCLFKFGLIPRTEPYVVKRFRLRDLKQLPRDWEDDKMTAKSVISTINDFSKAYYASSFEPIFTIRGMKPIESIFREYIGGDTGKDLLLISKRCISDALVNEFNLQEIKSMIENWKGENIDEVRTLLSHYMYKLESFTEQEEEELKLTGFFTGLDDVIESFLGENNYKTLEIMILFFEKIDELKCLI